METKTIMWIVVVAILAILVIVFGWMWYNAKYQDCNGKKCPEKKTGKTGVNDGAF